MQAFIQIIIKEFYHIVRDIRTLVVLFGIPAAQLVLFGYAIRTEINDADIGIMDLSKDYITTEITSKILSSGYFRLNGYYTSEKQIEKAFKAGQVKQVIIFESNFAYKLLKENKANIQVINDASNPNLATLLNNYTFSIINNYQNEQNLKNQSQPLTIIPEVKMLYNPEMKSVNNFVPGLIALLMMLICALMTSITITKEKEFGNMEILLVSPIKPEVIILGKVVPYVLLSLVIGSVVLGLSLLIFSVPFNGSVVLFYFEIFIYLITALTLGIFISTIAKTQQVAMLVSLGGLLLPTVLLSGFIFPIENMPWFLQFISNFIPAKWFLIIIRSIMLKGIGLEYFWKETLVLIGMSLVLIFLSMRLLKVRLE